MRRLETVQRLLSKTKIIRIPEKLTGNRLSLNKRLKLLQLRGIDKAELDNLARKYYQERIKTHFIDDIVSILQQRKSEGYTIVLVSGGYDIYLKYFASEYGVDKVISTRVGFEKDACSGCFDGLDCLNDNKVKLLDKYFNKSVITYSEAYSDSKSDVPFLRWVDKGFVVSKGKHQNWVDRFNFNEIVWTRKK